MTQKDKELLLKDLCARLPYGVRIKIETIIGSYARVEFTLSLETFNRLKIGIQEDGYSIKPYLRPMSSMTEEEKIEANNLGIFTAITPNGEKVFDGFGNVSCEIQLKAFDWLNAYHFDYRGLIEKSLAIVAPEGIYKKD